MKNPKYSLLDSGQMASYTFDEENDAQRVVVVGGSDIASSIKEALKDIKVTVEAQTQPQVTNINQGLDPLVIKIPYQTVVKEIEIKEIEKPIIIEKTKIVEIEKPVIVTKTEVITVEKQIIVTQQEAFPKIIAYILAVQAVIELISLLTRH